MYGIAADGNGNVYVAMADAGLYQPPHDVYVGTLAVLSSTFGSLDLPSPQIASTKTNGVNEPYGIATAADGNVYVVNDYVSIVNQYPGTGPTYSTLTRYAHGLTSAKVLPDATISAGLAWPTSVGTDVAGDVYVGNNTPPSPSGRFGPFFLRRYRGGFSNGEKPVAVVDLSAHLPKSYRDYYLNIQGVAIYPGPLQQ